MFGIFGNNRSKTTKFLVNQAIGGQSVLYRLFRDVLECEDKKIRLVELTYFALAVLAYIYLRLVKEKDRETILDDATREVLNSTLPHCREVLSFSAAVAEYRRRYSEYDRLLQQIFTKDGLDDHACITLVMHLYECTTQKSAQ